MKSANLARHLYLALAGLALSGCLFSDVVHRDGDAGGPADGGGDAPLDAPWPDAPGLTDGVDTLAGNGETGIADGNRAVARFDDPVNVVRGPDDTIYVADFNNGLLRAIGTDGLVRTVIAQANFTHPFGLVFGADGTLYVETDDNDLGEHRADTGTIWAVDVATGAAEALARNLGRPRGLAVLSDGRLVLSDPDFHIVSLMEPSTGAVTLIAGVYGLSGYQEGSGAEVRFHRPYGVAVRPDDTIVVADYANHILRLVTPAGEVSRFAGYGGPGYRDGVASEALFHSPQDVAIDAAGTLYVADSDNFVIRAVSLDGMVSTYAGDGNGGYRDDLDPMQARFYGLEGLDAAPDGTIYVADGNRGGDDPYHRVRRITNGE